MDEGAQMRGHDVPFDYHRILLDDGARVDAFDRAIRALVRPGDVVLDLGTGTGILAVLAARAGAARVHAVESMAVAGLAREVAAANGVADVVFVHRADAVELEPVEPVDLVVGDFLGRFLVDDEMLDAVVAAGRWLKPGGRFCPSRVCMYLGAVGNFALPQVDRFEVPVLGVDLQPGRRHAQAWCYPATLGREQLISNPAEYGLLEPPDSPVPADGEVLLRIERGGQLRGVAGWFEADLATGVVLTTAPGHNTHWGQILFPIPRIEVEPGDHLRVRVMSRVEENAWAWEGELTRRDQVNLRFDMVSVREIGDARPEPVERPGATREQVRELTRRAAASFNARRMAEAAATLEGATASLGPDLADMAGPLYENLGLAYLNQGLCGYAEQCFLRALDGQPTSREQALRWLVVVLQLQGKTYDMVRYLEAYEAAFGPHPESRGVQGA
jgi:SAM-dependent methyltransferase